MDPYYAVLSQVPRILSTYRSGDFQKVFLVGFGKAAFLMANAVSDHAPDIITRGIIITKYGHTQGQKLSSNIEIYEAGHPVPDERGVEATRKAIEMLKVADEKTLILCLISGGGSALLVSPKTGLSLDDKQAVTNLLLKAGASISELNTVRKHISDIKGGRLAEYAYPAHVISLILSDVIGDSFDVIASGPTSPDSTTYAMARDVLKKYDLTAMVPMAVKDILDAGVAGKLADSPKDGNPIFSRVENIIVGSNTKAILAAERKAAELGYDTMILSTELTGEAADAARWLATHAIEVHKSLQKKHGKTTCLISGGETTVTVKGTGKGGRNTELALVFALETQGIQRITFLSAGTDGTDGPTDAAGAIVNEKTIQNASSFGLDPVAYLKNNDSYTFFSRTGELFMTGPTGTNVMDIQIILIGYP